MKTYKLVQVLKDGVFMSSFINLPSHAVNYKVGEWAEPVTKNELYGLFYFESSTALLAFDSCVPKSILAILAILAAPTTYDYVDCSGLIFAKQEYPTISSEVFAVFECEVEPLVLDKEFPCLHCYNFNIPSGFEIIESSTDFPTDFPLAKIIKLTRQLNREELVKLLGIDKLD